MLCSIIIPTKNRPIGLKSAVVSALKSLPKSSEIIVVDDGSSPSADSTLKEFMDERLRTIVNPGPHGPSQARNLGVKNAKGRTIFFLDDDDELLPHYCKGVIEKRHTLPDNCAYGHCSALHAKGSNGSQDRRRKQKTGVYDEKSSLDSRLAGLGMGFWIDRKAFQKAGGIDPNISVNEDTEFCIRLASAGLCSFYDAEAGVLLSLDGERPVGDQGSITRAVKAAERARGFEYIMTQHWEYLLGHPRFRRRFLTRAIKYRSRAKAWAGWKNFCMTIQPATDRVFCSTVGSGWLYISIIMRQIFSR